MRGKLVQLTGNLLLALLLSGLCSMPPPSAAHDATPSPNALPAIVVTRDGGDASNCGPREAASLVARFVDAFNRGDQDRVMSFFGSDFKWFGVGADVGWDGVTDFFAYDPASGFASAGPDALVGSAEETLPPYFAERHANGDRWQLIDIIVFPEQDGEISSIFFHLTRRSDDLPPGNGDLGHRYIGQGQVNCPAETIILWSMNPARPGSGDDQPACPALSTDAAAPSIIACGSRSTARGPVPHHSSRR